MNKLNATMVDWRLVYWPQESRPPFGNSKDSKANALGYQKYAVVLIGKAKNDPRYDPKTGSFEDGNRLISMPVVAVEKQGLEIELDTGDAVYVVKTAEVNPEYAGWCERNNQTILPDDIDSIQAIRFEMQLRHVCECCGKEELLTPEEAYKQGWDYPPRMGRFGRVSPRTCENCGLIDTLFFKLSTGAASIATLNDHDKETLSRILREPSSIVP